jgi:hypothetical protein
MHPALYSWRDELSDAIVRWLALVCGGAVLSLAVAQIFQPQSGPRVARPVGPAWVDIEKPFPAFALSIPEAADAPASYAVRRNRDGGGRKDILGLGDADGADPYLRVEVYRPGSEISRFATPTVIIAADAAALGTVDLRPSAEPLPTKFGPMTVMSFETARGTPRQCLGFVRSYADPMLQLSGWFCRGGEVIDRATLACALDRLTLISAGSQPTVGALFADAELHRSYCGQHDPILAATPKYHLLWKALESRPKLRRIDQ